jgi:hypothetical protein
MLGPWCPGESSNGSNRIARRGCGASWNAHAVKILATLRADGSRRVSGVELDAAGRVLRVDRWRPGQGLRRVERA